MLRLIRKCQRGMTLIEIMITLGIIASLTVFGVAVIGSPDKSMRDVSNHLVRVMNYVYNQAALNNQYFRIVFDLNEQKYHVEFSDTPFYVVHEGDEIEAIRLENEAEAKGNDDGEIITDAAAVGSFAESEDELLKIFELPDNIRFIDVFVEHQQEAVEEGKAYLFFFPKGHTEFAVIHLGPAEEDYDDEDVMTLIVNPLSGKVDVRNEYVDHDLLLRSLGE